MNVPPAFDKMIRTFHQDWGVVYESFDEAIKDSVRLLSTEEKSAAKGFLDDVLNADYSETELANMWNNSKGAAGGISIESGASLFLDKLRAALIESL